MHPAKSVIFFTTATGAGYGLLVALFAYSLLGEAPADNSFTWGAFFSAFFLIIAGLLSSTLHLGHPMRVWRALSQWRSSWLSREGVAAMLTFVPAGLFLYSWLTFGMTSIYTFLFGALTAILSLATVYCTAMIYVSLKAIPAWRNLWTLPVYLSFSIMTGTVLFNLLVELFAVPTSRLPLYSSVGFLLYGYLFKGFYWVFVKSAPKVATIQSATGLKASSIRQLDAPHDSANYLMDEMGFRIARKHARKLWPLSIFFGFVAPTAILALSFVSNLGGDVYPAGLALFYMTIGVVIERWLFFAEAKHVVTLYYGEEKV